MNAKKWIFVGVIFLLGAGLGFGGSFLFKSGASSAQADASTTPATNTNPASSDIGVAHDVPVVDAGDGNAEYHNSKYGFSLKYPDDLTVKEYNEEAGGMTVVFQKPDEQKGFQIYISAYAGTSITKDIIHRDIPSGVMKDSVEVVIGDSIRALHFTSKAPVIGDSSEVWFIKNGNLFEVTTYSPLDAWLAGILSSIHFNK